MSALVAALLLAASGARPLPAATPAAAPAEAAAPPVVGDVELVVPEGESIAPLRALVPLAPGQPLSRRALRRAVQALYAVGRFGDVVARTRPVEGVPRRVVVVLECTPRATLGALRFNVPSRAGLAERRLRSAAALLPGDELWPGRLDEAVARVRAACARAGYPRAAVRATTAGARDVTVEVTVDPGAPTHVAALDLGGTPAAIAAELSTRAGAVLDLDRLDEDVRALRAGLRRDGWLRARVGAPAISPEGDDARVAIPVQPGPHVRFLFAGNAAMRAAELEAELGLEAEPALDAEALQAAAGRLTAAYQARGFAAARVTVAERAGRDEVRVLFRVDEGRRYRVGAVRVTGARTRGEAWARERFLEALEASAPPDPTAALADAERAARAAGRPPFRRAPPGVAPGEVWDPPLWDAAMARLLELYRSDGYLEAAYEGTRATLDARSGLVVVELRLAEGVRTRVASVTFEGNEAIPLAELAREARVAKGDPLSYAALEATRAALLALYARRGYAYARVADADELSADRTSAAVRFRITEGPRVRVANVVVAGARRTREDVVRDAVALKPGDVYDPDAVARSQATLLRLGAFRSVGLHLADPDAPEASKDLVVEISERPWRTLAPGIGYSLANGPRAFVELLEPNVLGRALELSARAKVNYPPTSLRHDLADMPVVERAEGRGEVGLHDPRAHLLGLTVGARVDGILERLHRPSYDLSRASTIFGVELPMAQRLSLTLQYELEVDHVLHPPGVADTSIPLTRADVERLRFPEGVTTLNSLRPVLALDLRDDPVRPRHGFFASATADYSHSLGASGGALLGVPGSDVFTHMVKLSGNVTGYLPLGSSSAFALSLRGGRVLPLDRRSQTILPKRFFLGGAATMRGYGEDEMQPEDVRPVLLDQVRACANSLSQVACSAVATQLGQGVTQPSQGGEAFALAKAELRIPLRDGIELGLFTDVGNLWLDPQFANLLHLRVNFGAGLRFATPIGPAVLDVGINPEPDRRLGEGVVAPHFSIGVF